MAAELLGPGRGDAGRRLGILDAGPSTFSFAALWDRATHNLNMWSLRGVRELQLRSLLPCMLMRLLLRRLDPEPGRIKRR